MRILWGPEIKGTRIGRVWTKYGSQIKYLAKSSGPYWAMYRHGDGAFLGQLIPKDPEYLQSGGYE